jgi:hypothetical protein
VVPAMVASVVVGGALVAAMLASRIASVVAVLVAAMVGSRIASAVAAVPAVGGTAVAAMVASRIASVMAVLLAAVGAVGVPSVVAIRGVAFTSDVCLYRFVDLYCLVLGSGVGDRWSSMISGSTSLSACTASCRERCLGSERHGSGGSGRRLWYDAVPQMYQRELVALSVSATVLLSSDSVALCMCL